MAERQAAGAERIDLLTGQRLPIAAIAVPRRR